MGDVLRLRKHLSEPQPKPAWPGDIALVPVVDVKPEALHTILEAAYLNGFGSVRSFAQWWPSILSDSEYDPDLLFIAADQSGQPVGLALCWNSGFIKDIAVDNAWRGRGIGESLLHAVFAACHQRGLDHVDLKVVAANAAAIRLYRRVGMVDING